VDIRDGHLVGVEALARWDHPVLGEVSPSTFIPIAEETGLIGQVGVWGLRTACREAVRWAEAGGEQFRVAVNLSAQQLRQRDLARTVAEILAETGLDPSSLALELTESVLMENSKSNVSTLQELVEMGVQIHLDDFGTGYSSLSYIKRFSIDKLKIDQSFVRDIPGDPDGRALAAMIIAMAHATNIRVAAEGVERQDQLDFLREQGCDEMQGFLFSKPVPAEDIGPMFRDKIKIAG
jgi:EAL domain-containing protein (putative c-di-GMP-specific phosphodiesterase class I)